MGTTECANEIYIPVAAAEAGAVATSAAPPMADLRVDRLGAIVVERK
jgi:hypothetical protein